MSDDLFGNNNGNSDPLLAAVLPALENAIEAGATRRDELQAELDAINAEIKRCERARAALVETPKPRGPKPPGTRVRTKPAGIGDERLAAITEAIRGLAAENDEFSQVEVRSITGFNSGVTAIGFEKLRQDGMIRFARQDGLRKVFRLTREALNAETTKS
jgi:hypothetical protein